MSIEFSKSHKKHKIRIPFPKRLEGKNIKEVRILPVNKGRHFKIQYEEHNPEAELKDSNDVENINITASAHKHGYDKEDDQIIENFSVENPDFSGLDLLTAEENLNGQTSLQNAEIPSADSSAIGSMRS